MTNDDGLLMDSSTENTVLRTDKPQFIVHGWFMLFFLFQCLVLEHPRYFQYDLICINTLQLNSTNTISTKLKNHFIFYTNWHPPQFLDKYMCVRRSVVPLSALKFFNIPYFSMCSFPAFPNIWGAIGWADNPYLLIRTWRCLSIGLVLFGA